MKTKEELNAIKAEVETLNKKLAELTEDELEQVSGGLNPLVDQTLTSAPIPTPDSVGVDHGYDLSEIHNKLLEAERALRQSRNNIINSDDIVPILPSKEK